jgi:hypothetical protein
MNNLSSKLYFHIMLVEDTKKDNEIAIIKVSSLMSLTEFN